jgi:hypothetical protein
MAAMVYETDPVDPVYPLPAVGVNTAVIASVPTGSEEVASDDPITVPNGDPFTSNWMEPEATAAGGLTAMAKLREVPTYCGLGSDGVRVTVVAVSGLMTKVVVPVEPA